jgi:hypothetical protein
LPEDEKRESWFTDLRPYPGLTVEEAKKNCAPLGAGYYQDTPHYETCSEEVPKRPAQKHFEPVIQDTDR